MTRVIRPIGKVTPALKRHGYRQQAVIIVDGKQVENVAVLSRMDGKSNKVKFEGHWIDPNGELHKTNMFVDMKKAAARILMIKELADKQADNPSEGVIANKSGGKTAAAKRAERRGVAPAAKKSAPRSRPRRESEEGATLINCKGCGMVHRDDTLCP